MLQTETVTPTTCQGNDEACVHGCTRAKVDTNIIAGCTNALLFVAEVNSDDPRADRLNGVERVQQARWQMTRGWATP
jgi:hypothetical protein